VPTIFPGPQISVPPARLRRGRWSRTSRQAARARRAAPGALLPAGLAPSCWMKPALPKQKLATRWAILGNLTSHPCHCTLMVVIRSFRHRGLKRLWEGDPSRIGAALRDRVENVLAVLDAAATPADLDLPGYRLHALKCDLKALVRNGQRQLAYHVSRRTRRCTRR
jgi:plasmid maintenance system killer protein